MSNLANSGCSNYFDATVPLDGYRWWYSDVVSDDHKYCLVVIGFIGSVFSPYYAAARRRGPADPEQHCAINAVLYGPRRKHWAMTERSNRSLTLLQRGVAVGPSAMQFDGNALEVTLDERCNPLPTRLRGTLRIEPEVVTAAPYRLHSNQQHFWWPYAPVARAKVNLADPDIRFGGSAYIDTNFGHEPVEQGFRGWHWTRRESVPMDGTTPAMTYHTFERDGTQHDLTLALGADGLVPAPTPDSVRIRSGFWRVARQLRSAKPIQQIRTLEDTPFYVRSLLRAGDSPDTAYRLMHESLDLDRFASRWVQTLLPFRMPRRP